MGCVLFLFLLFFVVFTFVMAKDFPPESYSKTLYCFPQQGFRKSITIVEKQSPLFIPSSMSYYYNGPPIVTVYCCWDDHFFPF